MSKEFQGSKHEALHNATEMLGKTFIQRKDLFASQLEDGRYVAIKEALTNIHLALHLEGHITLGTYMLSLDSTTKILVLDADGENGLEELASTATALMREGIPTYLETSRRGGHLWFFIEHAHDGGDVRAFGKAILEQHNLHGVELYPKQDRLQGGPGSCIRLPFGKHKLTGVRYPFILPHGELLAPSVYDQIELLSAHQSVPEGIFNKYLTYQSEKGRSRPRRISCEGPASGDLETIKKALPLLDFLGGLIDLKPVASGAVGRCPFHDDQHASFGVNRDGNYWHCFAGCGGGNIFDFWMKWKGVDFPTAVRQLEELVGGNL